MATRKNKKHSSFKLNKKSSAALMLVTVLIAAILFLYKFFPEHFDFIFGDGDIPTGSQSGSSVEVNGKAEFHFIDVGQGDGMLIRTDKGDIVIDAGPSGSENDFVEYIKAQGVSVIEYLVLTHPHGDHIGGADAVLENFEVKRVLLPDTDCTTSMYTKVLRLVEKEKCEVIVPKVRDTYFLGDLKMTVLAPNSDDYDEGYNNYSVVIRAEYGESSVLLTGDAEKISEEEMLKSVPLDLLDCDLLKVGHHGSHTSTTTKFFNIVSPEYAVISCAKDNEYGHPHDETEKTLASLSASGKVYRTDISGSIVFTTNGKTFDIKCEK